MCLDRLRRDNYSGRICVLTDCGETLIQAEYVSSTTAARQLFRPNMCLDRLRRDNYSGQICVLTDCGETQSEMRSKTLPTILWPVALSIVLSQSYVGSGHPDRGTHLGSNKWELSWVRMRATCKRPPSIANASQINESEACKNLKPVPINLNSPIS